MTPRLSIALGTALAAIACAAPPPAPVRELASERYVVKDGDVAVGYAELTLTTTRQYGWHISEIVTRAQPSPGTLRLDWILSPDWTPRALEVLRQCEGRDLRAEYAVDPESGEVGGRALDLLSGVSEDVSPGREACGPIAADTPGSAMAWIRATRLDVGAKFEANSPHFCPDDLRARGELFTLERLPDRAGRCVYRYRVGDGAWSEIETDRRGLPLSWRKGAESFVRETRK